MQAQHKEIRVQKCRLQSAHRGMQQDSVVSKLQFQSFPVWQLQPIPQKMLLPYAYRAFVLCVCT